jgi:hypothetical protein
MGGEKRKDVRFQAIYAVIFRKELHKISSPDYLLVVLETFSSREAKEKKVTWAPQGSFITFDCTNKKC